MQNKNVWNKLHLEVATEASCWQFIKNKMATCGMKRTLQHVAQRSRDVTSDMISHAFDLFTCYCRQKISERYSFSAVQVVYAV